MDFNIRYIAMDITHKCDTKLHHNSTHTKILSMIATKFLIRLDPHLGYNLRYDDA